MTGECFEGQLDGARLDWWSVHMTTVQTALGLQPSTVLLKSNYRSPKASAMKLFAAQGSRINSKRTFVPPTFRRTMSGPIDDRLPKHTQGLGLISADEAKFYPIAYLDRGSAIVDSFDGTEVVISRSVLDGSVLAEPESRLDGARPMQIMSRWYGFSFNFPDCEIYMPGPSDQAPSPQWK